MSQTLAIIDYGSGNLRSATKAVERAALEGGIDTKIFVTADPEIVRRADRILLPGVGAYADCRQGLGSIEGMEEALIEAVETAAKPFLGICVGMQLMATRGLEKAVTHGFGWIPGDVVPIAPADPSLKIPQIGWNTLTVVQPHPLLDGIATGEEGLHAYFVHSYQLETDDPDTLVATTQYGGAITAMVARGNKVGTQFHPEKSQRLGLALLTNFLRWRP